MTTYYTFSGVPLAGSRGVSSLLRSEYTSIQTAFVTVNSEMVAKAPSESPTFTGTVTLPSTTSIGDVSATELSYLDGVTSAIQGQFDLKAPLEGPTFSGTVALPSTTSIGSVSAAEIAYLDGVTSNLQTQLGGKASKDGETYTGAHDFSGATAVSVPAPSAGAHAVPKDYADALAFSAALPLQTGQAGKYVTTDGTNASWATIPPPMITYDARTSNTILGAADTEKLVDITSGTFTQTFDAAATLGAGWFIYLRNSGTGDIPLGPNAGNTIDGLTGYVMYPGECRLIQCDGSALTSIVITPFSKTFTASDTFTKAPGYSDFGGLAWSGGNSGQRTNNTGAISVGGGGGGCFEFLIPASSFGATETVTIGAGGAAVTGVASGNKGGDTSLGSLLTVYAGAWNRGGSVMSGLTSSTGAAAFGFEGNSGTGGSVLGLSSIYGGAAPKSDASVDSGNSVFGGAAGGSLNATATVRSPGTSVFGGDGGAANSTTDGVDGTAPGGGGGATQTGSKSGAGARGELRIWGIA